MEILAISLAPVVFLFTYIYLSDKYEREPLRLLVKAFLLGLVVAFPAAILEVLLGSTNPSHTSGLNIPAFINATLFIAGIEELGKFLVLRYFLFPKPDFNEPYDGIMYAVAVSMGFAAIENILYVSSFGLSVGWIRMFTAVPAHASFAVLMGFYAGKAKFINNRSLQGALLRKGLAAAVLAHGLYDFFILSNVGVAIVLGFLVLLICIRLSFRAIAQHQEASRKQNFR